MATIKTTFKRIVCVLSCCLVVVFSFAFPSSAVTDVVFEYSISEPTNDVWSGYLIQPRSKFGYTNVSPDCYFWFIQPLNNPTDKQPDVQYMYDNTNKKVYLIFGSHPEHNYHITIYYTTTDGAVVVKKVGNASPSTNLQLTIDLGSNYDIFWRPQLSNVTTVSSDFPTGGKNFNVLWSADSVIYNELLEINQHFFSMLQKVDYTNEQLEAMLEYYQLILDSCYNMEYSLDLFVNYYWEQFQMNDFPIAMNDISLKLQKIYNLLNKSGEVEQSTVDSSNVDNYLDIEQSLVNNDEAESALNDFDISIEGASYSFIWDFITNIFNSHPEVFGLVITILTLGIIALLLNR